MAGIRIKSRLRKVPFALEGIQVRKQSLIDLLRRDLEIRLLRRDIYRMEEIWNEII